VRFLRLVGRGARDTFDQFLPLILFSLAWWVAQPLVLTGPPATATLFAMADPRRQSSVPDWSDAIATFRLVFLRSWGVALWTVPLIAILLWNLLFFGGTEQTLAVLAPLWTLMILLLLILAGYAQAVIGILAAGVRDAFRAATFLLVSRPLTSLALLLFLIVLFGVMLVLVVPLILIGPGLVASIVNRFVLAGLDIEVIDPNQPTPERSVEQRQTGNVRDPLFHRARRGGSRR
jgi:uncharacterized membrane protein YesL